jgi:hypothetical protein
MQNAGSVGGWRSGRGWPGQVAAATKTTAGNRVNQDDPITSDQIKPNPTKKNGPARIMAQAVRSKLARTDLDLGRARCRRGNAERMNGKTKGLSDRNTFLIYDTVERGLGLEENLHLSSLKFAYLRISSIIGRKIVAAPHLISDASSRFRSGCGRGRPRSRPQRVRHTGSDSGLSWRGGLAAAGGSCRYVLSVSGTGLASTRTNRRNPGGRYGRYATLIGWESIPGWASRKLAFTRELAEYGPTQQEPCQPKLVFPWPPPVYGWAV